MMQALTAEHKESSSDHPASSTPALLQSLLTLSSASSTPTTTDNEQQCNTIIHTLLSLAQESLLMISSSFHSHIDWNKKRDLPAILIKPITQASPCIQHLSLFLSAYHTDLMLLHPVAPLFTQRCLVFLLSQAVTIYTSMFLSVTASRYHHMQYRFDLLSFILCIRRWAHTLDQTDKYTDKQPPHSYHTQLAALDHGCAQLVLVVAILECDINRLIECVQIWKDRAVIDPRACMSNTQVNERLVTQAAALWTPASEQCLPNDVDWTSCQWVALLEPTLIQSVLSACVDQQHYTISSLFVQWVEKRPELRAEDYPALAQEEEQHVESLRALLLSCTAAQMSNQDTPGT